VASGSKTVVKSTRRKKRGESTQLEKRGVKKQRDIVSSLKGKTLWLITGQWQKRFTRSASSTAKNASGRQKRAVGTEGNSVKSLDLRRKRSGR